MQPSPRAPLESLLADLYQRETDLDGQLGELNEQIEGLRGMNKPIGQRRLAKFEQLREAFWATKLRIAQLKAQQPDTLRRDGSAPGDF